MCYVHNFTFFSVFKLSELITHKKSLQFRLNQLSSSSHAHPQKAIIDPTHPLNPLVTQEQPLNKYSAMVTVYSICSEGI